MLESGGLPLQAPQIRTIPDDRDAYRAAGLARHGVQLMQCATQHMVFEVDYPAHPSHTQRLRRGKRPGIGLGRNCDRDGQQLTVAEVDPKVQLRDGDVAPVHKSDRAVRAQDLKEAPCLAPIARYRKPQRGAPESRTSLHDVPEAGYCWH